MNAPKILVLCTGNQGRSPIGQALLASRLQDRNIEATITSAGLVSDNVPATNEAQKAMSERGLDISTHRSHVFEIKEIQASDLVIVMTKEHAREICVAVEDALPKTYPLIDLVRRAELLPRHDGEPFEPWLARIGEGRSAGDLLGIDTALDIADPVGKSTRFYRKIASQIDELLERFVTSAFG